MEEVSIIIPAYNRLGTLRRVLPTYLNQEGVLEIIVVDDHGTDGTERFIKHLMGSEPKVKYWKNDRNLGLPGNRNMGVSLAAGQYIFFGEDDLYLKENHIQALLTALLKTQSDIIGGRLIYLLPDESERQAIHRSDKYKGPFMTHRLFLGHWQKRVSENVEVIFLHACALMRRQVFDHVRYDTAYKGNSYREETDFYVEASKHGFKIYFCPHALAFHLHTERKHGGGVWSQGILRYKYWSLRNCWRFLQKHYPYVKEKLGFQDSMIRIYLCQVFYEIARSFPYFLREHFPTIYSPLNRAWRSRS